MFKSHLNDNSNVEINHHAFKSFLNSSYKFGMIECGVFWSSLTSFRWVINLLLVTRWLYIWSFTLVWLFPLLRFHAFLFLIYQITHSISRLNYINRLVISYTTYYIFTLKLKILLKPLFFLFFYLLFTFFTDLLFIGFTFYLLLPNFILFNIPIQYN